MKATRQSLITIIHTAKKILHLDDDTYRALLLNITKKNSCKDMSNTELESVLKELRRCGFSSNTKKNNVATRTTNANNNENKHNTKAYFQNAQYRMCYALWVELYNDHIVENKSADALNAYIERMLPVFKNIKSLIGIDVFQMGKIIDSLKNWHARIELDRGLEAGIKSGMFTPEMSKQFKK